ncbi:hypothetical protein PR202_ga22389 [Eleusine coracana subsp. coracana]|uniref:Uncharacterized protein n=1 Tax=Eleusine coracana subsp. coracana TaxID=191504 RepID=A0AAV5D1K2_ELECO|nr:hypothetical protein PR202_ga22389 [Eleusine coracana subsp. coracana]
MHVEYRFLSPGSAERRHKLFILVDLFFGSERAASEIIKFGVTRLLLDHIKNFFGNADFFLEFKGQGNH